MGAEAGAPSRDETQSDQARRASRALSAVVLAFLATFAGLAIPLLPTATAAPGGAVLDNGVVALGVLPLGSLGVDSAVMTNCNRANQPQHADPITLRHDGLNSDANCQAYEAWGLAYTGASSCWATATSVAVPWAGLSSPPPTPVSFTATATTAVSVVTCGDIQMTQSFSPQPGFPQIFRDDIQIVNTCMTCTLTNVQFRRTMGWFDMNMHTNYGGNCQCQTAQDIDTLPTAAPTPASLVATGLVEPYAIGPPALSGPVPDPTVPLTYAVQGPPGGPPVYHFAYVQTQSMVYDLNFGTLGPGSMQPFVFYYGADTSTDAATAALTTIGAQVYNYDNPVPNWDTQAPTQLPGPVGVFAYQELPKIDVTPPAGPTASHKGQQTNGCGLSPVQFTDSSTAGGAPIVGWAWDFGDGSTSTDQNPLHYYGGEGTYAVTETVTDANGNTNTVSSTVDVTTTQCTEPTISQSDPQGIRPPHDGTDPAIAGADADGDGVANALDNCVFAANADQADSDADLAGDACDIDADNDGLANNADNCPTTANPNQEDLDGNGEGDPCDDDQDGDHVLNGMDNCPTVPNTLQGDVDADGVGDACQIKTLQALAVAPTASRDLTTDRGVSAPAQPQSTVPLLLPVSIAAALGAFAIGLVAAGRRRRR